MDDIPHRVSSVMVVSEALVSRERQIQMQWILEWFSSWDHNQKIEFKKTLLEKAVPNKICTLFDAMKKMQVKENQFTSFECQIKLFNEWFQGWSSEERNFFIVRLDETDSEFITEFFNDVAATNGVD